MFYREATRLSKEKFSPVGYVLLLHGQAFTSANWAELGTLSFLAKLKLRVIAVDLPGYGQSSQDRTSSPLTFMEDLVTALKLDSSPFILVSPSMSGKYSLPYLVAHPEKVKGYVPVAPVGTEEYVDRYSSIIVSHLSFSFILFISLFSHLISHLIICLPTLMSPSPSLSLSISPLYHLSGSHGECDRLTRRKARAEISERSLPPPKLRDSTHSKGRTRSIQRPARALAQDTIQLGQLALSNHSER